jgi:hypothetical protein
MGVVTDVLAATNDGSAIGPGLAGFLIFALLVVAVLFLYRSLRKQLNRIDFDPTGETDAERMRRREPRIDGEDDDHNS